MKNLIIGTDFSGIGSPEQAIKNLEIEHEVEFACEIDKYARETYLANHKCKVMYEDITTRNHSEVPQLDLYIAGIPCQSFSLAGKRKGFEDVRGTLFFDVAEFIKENQPKVFILENVKGLLSHDKPNKKAEFGNTFNTIINLLSDNGGIVNGQTSIPFYEDGLGYNIYYKVLNTKEHGIPQNRERIFIVGFRNYREYRFPIKEPLKLKLKDLLEEDVDKKYYLSEKAVRRLKKHDQSIGFTDPNKKDVANCIISGYNKIPGDGEYIVVHSLQPRSGDPKKGGTGHLSKDDGTTYCLDTGNSQCIQVADYRYDEGLRIRKDNISPCLNASGDPPIVIKSNIYRKFTPLEFFRLQGFTDDFKKVVSDTQLYRQGGNSITVNVIQKVIQNIYHA